jgi:hemerythrin-like domain-containing protein
MKVYKAIKNDHDIQRDLCNKLLETSGKSEERRDLWTQLKKELEVHALAEERFFYSPLIDSDEMQEDARHGIAEHHEMDELIEEVDNRELDSPHWLTSFKKLADKVEHHLDDEEKDFFNGAKKIYSEDEAESLAMSYEETMEKYRQQWPELA